MDGIETIRQVKRELRSQLRTRLAAMSPPAREAASAQLRERLVSRPEWAEAGSILFFAPIRQEPDIWPLAGAALSMGKVVALPWFSKSEGKYLACRVRNVETDIATGHLGIREPLPGCGRSADIPVRIPRPDGGIPEALNRLDLILVPGVGFDPCCHRLGRGNGFYDQILADVEGRKCGVGFDEQLINEIPLEPHDMALDCILTPTRWIEPSAAGL